VLFRGNYRFCRQGLTPSQCFHYDLLCGVFVQFCFVKYEWLNYLGQSLLCTLQRILPVLYPQLEGLALQLQYAKQLSVRSYDDGGQPSRLRPHSWGRSNPQRTRDLRDGMATKL